MFRKKSTEEAEYAHPATQEAQGVKTSEDKKPETNEELSKEGVVNKKLVSAAFGEMVGLFMRSPNHKYNTLTDLEWMVLPGLLTGQYRVAEARDQETGQTAPVAAVLWAEISDERDKEFTDNIDRPVRLKPNEWKSGKNIWIIEVVGNGDIARQLLGLLRQTEFQDKTVKMRVRSENGDLKCASIDDIAIVPQNTTEGSNG